MCDLVMYFLAYVAPTVVAIVLVYLLLTYEEPRNKDDDPEPYGEASSFRRERKP